jgi:hypothetical protein
MNAREFFSLPKYETMLDGKGLKVGDKFLTGAKVINQTDCKSIGDMITYYEVLTIGLNGNVSYTQRMERLVGLSKEEQQ